MTHRPPRIAVVILNFRTAGASVHASQSVSRSTRRIDDLVIVDNGSGDGSAGLLRREVPEARIEATGRNLGFSGGVNVGITAALNRGADMVLLMNSDLTVEPTCVEELERALARNPRAGIAAPLIVSTGSPARVESAGIVFSRFTGRMRHLSFGRELPLPAAHPQEVTGVSGAAMLIRAELLRSAGLFDERYFFSYEDLEFCLRAASAGFSTISVPGAIAHHQGGLTLGASSPRRLYFGLRNHLLICDSPHAAVALPFRMLRVGTVLALNVAYAARRSDIPVWDRLAALGRAVSDHWHRRYGADR